ncbi:hypothetical protein T10_3284 [Trichinella papuae]|uniref:Uncharacterized protein n=1 Tax=Trichinella papuae TaxID=268474 RepID=A0A0V1N198_9BILA|nr:hypothetical protein T10_3284 [Trichinella papuae]
MEKGIKFQVVLLRCFVHAAVPIFQVVVDSHILTMHNPKRNFSGPKPLSLEVLEQSFNLT